MKKRNIISLLMMSLLLGSCSSEDILTMPNGNGRIRFDVGVSQSQEVVVTPMNGGATRSAEPLFLPTSSIEMHSGDMTMYANCASTADIPMHNIIPETTTRGSIQTADNFYSEFGIFGYFYDSTQSWASIKSSISPNSSMDNLNVTQTSKSWTTNVYWPGGTKKATFFAYAPYNSSATLTSDTGAPKITYTVPSDIAQQRDLLVAKSIENISCDGNSTVALDFKHALSAIKFVKGDTPGYKEIKGIQISGVYNQGTLNMNSQSWENTSGSDTYSISTIDENTVCFLMPQSVPSGAKLSVTLTNGGTEHTFEADLGGTTWEAGHQYTYELSVNKVTGTFYFEVTSPTDPVPVNGGDATFNVKSYFQYQDNTKNVPIPWSCSYTIGDTSYTLNGDGSVEGEEQSIIIGANTFTHTQVLQNNPVKGSEASPYDLSTNGGKSSMNTANCYVVNSKGTYSIPLVYGCAIKGGQPNEISYKSNTFVNHAGEHITTPYIYKMVTNIDGAKLIWQDVQNMVTNIKLSSDKQSLIFKIDNIAQGNAVVAATASGTVVWSWHIWVTDRDVSVTAAVPTKAFDTSHTYNFMPVPLGWCDGGTSNVAPRNFTLSLIQGQSGKNLSATIAQAGSTATSGNFTYYQWGRKDPFVGSTGTGNTCKTWYDGSGTQQSSLKINNSTRTKKYAITNPEYFIYGASQWDTGTTTYDDWNANLSSNTAPSPQFNYTVVEKTVYDPSPVGYKLPPTNAFTGFGKALGTGAQTANGSGFSNGGWNFYTGGQSTGPTDFWIAGGYRNWNNSGSLSIVGSNGYYWSAGPFSNALGCNLFFNSSGVSPRNYYYRAIGISVRPVSE